MAANGKKNSDSLIAAALAAGKSIPEAAAEAHVSERTVSRRKDDPNFQKQVVALRAKFIDAALGRLADASCDAVDRLRALLAAESETVQLGAARAILELGSKLRESVELEQRISELEGRAAN